MANLLRGLSMEGQQPQSARPYVPSSMAGDLESMMVDMILGEIQAHITRIEEDQERRRQDSLKASQTPDYSWLMDWKLKNKKECSAVEMLCQKVRPSEWSPLIKEWRSRARYVDQREGVIALFRSVVEEIVQRRLAGATQVSLVDELAASADAQGWPERLSPTPGPRSASVAELSAPALASPATFNEARNVV